MLKFLIASAALLYALHIKRLMNEEREFKEINEEMANGSGAVSAASDHFWSRILTNYGMPSGQYIVSILFSLYKNFTFFNVTVFLLKYVPTGLYMYKFMKNVYMSSRERVIQKQSELDDIKLQIEIVNTKICVRDAEYSERSESLKQGTERLRRIRTRVREFIASNEPLRRALEEAPPWDEDPDLQTHRSPEAEREFIMDLLKDLKCDPILSLSDKIPEKIMYAETPQGEPATENSVHSSLSEGDLKQDCRVKIIKVTNVYQIAYLNHFVKQRRLRRVTKQALFKKRMEKVKKLLEDWQKTLNAVTHNMSLLSSDRLNDDIMGESQPPPRESSDMDSDERHTGEMQFEDYGLSWVRNPYGSCAYRYEDDPQTAMSRDLYLRRQGPYSTTPLYNKSVLLEETKSQIAIEEQKSNASDEEDIFQL